MAGRANYTPNLMFIGILGLGVSASHSIARSCFRSNT
jgi:hypothetical protein